MYCYKVTNEFMHEILDNQIKDKPCLLHGYELVIDTQYKVVVKIYYDKENPMLALATNSIALVGDWICILQELGSTLYVFKQEEFEELNFAEEVI